MILPVHERLRESLIATLGRAYHLSAESAPAVVLEYPPSRELGDLATPVAFELARRLRRPPRAIAQDLALALGPIDGVQRVVAAPSGYLNVYLDRAAFLIERVTRAPAPMAFGGGKLIVEHTAINPNKAAHIGHLRNAALGDTLVRVQRFRGAEVEVQNYIDDTGVQVADVVVGFQELEGRQLDGIRAIADSTRFDYYCWDLYARVTAWYQADPERLKLRAAALHAIEHGVNETASMARLIADRIVGYHLRTMARMNVDYDLLTWENDILRLQFWARAFEILKEHDAVHLQTRGKLAGCWVMTIQDEPESAGEADAEEEPDEESREKVIVRSNGTVTYVAKDMAYQLWKFGLLGRDFHYRPYPGATDRPLWSTSSTPSDQAVPRPAFGGGSATYNVIDVRQAYLQKLLKQALAALGYTQQAARSTHFSYEMVALSPATAAALGYVAAEEADGKRGFVEVSGRKGQGVKADDLLDTLAARAEIEVARRNPGFAAAENRRIGEMIAIAAVRYFMIKYSRTKVIAFDIDEALNFEGESGPYLQYAVVRAQNIFNKLRERDGLDEQAVYGTLSGTPAGELTGEEGSHDVWSLVLEASRLDEIVEQVVRTLEFSVLAKYAFGLAQTFNAFYHRFPILNEERAAARRWRAAAAGYFRVQMARALELMGIPVPPRM
jgi:arginyl-tRNA synthetase